MNKKMVLACEKCGSRNYSYAAKPAQSERLELKKYCKNCCIQTVHRETK